MLLRVFQIYNVGLQTTNISKIYHRKSIRSKILIMNILGRGFRLRKKEGGVLYPDLHGLMPIKDDQKNEFDDIVLNGKLVFY